PNRRQPADPGDFELVARTVGEGCDNCETCRVASRRTRLETRAGSDFRACALRAAELPAAHAALVPGIDGGIICHRTSLPTLEPHLADLHHDDSGTPGLCCSGLPE